MDKKLLAAALAMSAFAAADASAFYIGAAGGTAKTEIEGTKIGSDAAFTVAAGIGIPLPLFAIRAEGEYLQLKSSDDALDAKTYGFAANGYVNLPLLPIVHPYVGFGLASLKQEAAGMKSDSKVAPQYMIGLDVDIPLLPIAGGVEFRYIDVDFDYSGAKNNSKIQTVLAKVRYSF
jgi:opacity protein-like surface antigen